MVRWFVHGQSHGWSSEAANKGWGTLHKLTRTCKSAQTRTRPWFEAHLYLSADVDQETQKPYHEDKQLSSRSPDV